MKKKCCAGGLKKRGIFALKTCLAMRSRVFVKKKRKSEEAFYAFVISIFSFQPPETVQGKFEGSSRDEPLLDRAALASL